MDPIELTVQVSGDITIAGLDWRRRSGQPPLVLLHPNGFCGGVFAPLAELLSADFRVIALDLRGHGQSSAPEGLASYAYVRLAGDVLHALDQLGVQRPLVVGQSLGGAVAVLADRIRPGWAAKILLCEAAAYPSSLSEHRSNPLADGARRRRREWPSVQAIREAYGSKPALAELSSEALDGYMRWGTRPTQDGTVELCCDPEVEASLFELAATPLGGAAAWDHLQVLRCPAAVLFGADSFLPVEYFIGQAAAIGVDLETVPGGHFFLQGDPLLTSRLVADQMSRP